MSRPPPRELVVTVRARRVDHDCLLNPTLPAEGALRCAGYRNNLLAGYDLNGSGHLLKHSHSPFDVALKGPYARGHSSIKFHRGNHIEIIFCL